RMILNKEDGGIVIYSLPGTLDCPNYCENNIVAKTHEAGKVAENDIMVYPNPTAHLCTIEYQLAAGVTSSDIQVLDLNGKVVMQERVHDSHVRHTFDLN